MVRRVGERNRFWDYTNFPRCRNKRDIKHHLRRNFIIARYRLKSLPICDTSLDSVVIAVLLCFSSIAVRRCPHNRRLNIALLVQVAEYLIKRDKCLGDVSGFSFFGISFFGNFYIDVDAAFTLHGACFSAHCSIIGVD